MAAAKFQLEESNKPHPRYVLDFHAIRGMIQEADNMDKGMRTALGLKLATQVNVSVPQQPQQPPSTGATSSFTHPVPHPAPYVSVSGSRQPPNTPFVPGRRRKQSQARTPEVSVSTPTSTPGIRAPSPRTPRSPKGKAAAKPKVQSRRKVSAKANSLEMASSASAVPSISASSTSVDTKGGAKRAREDEVGGAMPGAGFTKSSRRVKSDCEGPPNDEDEHPEYAEAASLNEIPRTTTPTWE